MLQWGKLAVSLTIAEYCASPVYPKQSLGCIGLLGFASCMARHCLLQMSNHQQFLAPLHLLALHYEIWEYC